MTSLAAYSNCLSVISLISLFQSLLPSLLSKFLLQNSKTKFFKSGETEKEWINVDIGPNSIKKFDEIIMQSKKILWNGPMGVYEIDKYSAGTNHIANSISNSTKNGSISLIGGGDSVAVVTKQKLKKHIFFDIEIFGFGFCRYGGVLQVQECGKDPAVPFWSFERVKQTAQLLPVPHPATSAPHDADMLVCTVMQVHTGITS